MNIDTEAKYLQHPQARLIPISLWKMYFQKAMTFSTEEQELMRLPLTDIHRFEMIPGEFYWIRYWLCILLGHPDADDEELLNKADELGITPNILFKGALLTQHMAMLNKIDIDAAQKRRIVLEDNYFIFHHAISCHYLEVLAWLKAEFRDKWQHMIDAKNSEGFRCAVEIGHLEMLQWLKEETSSTIQHMIKAKDYDAFYIAAKHGYLEILMWFQEQMGDAFPDLLETIGKRAFYGAMGNAHVHVLTWLNIHIPEKVSSILQESFSWRDQKAHIKYLLWFQNNFADKVSEMIKAHNYFIFFLAAENGHLDSVIWLKTMATDVFEDMVMADNYRAFEAAAENGHIHILQWLKEANPDIFLNMFEAKKYGTFCKAAANGHLKILMWIKDVIAPAMFSDMMLTFSKNAFVSAAGGGYLNVLEWFKDEAPEMVNGMTGFAFYAAACEGHLNILTMLTVGMPPNKLDDFIQYYLFQSIHEKKTRCDLDTLRWFKAQGLELFNETIPDTLTGKYGNYRIFCHAVQRGYLDVLTWFKKESSSDYLRNMMAAHNYHAVSLASLSAFSSTMLLWIKNQYSAETYEQIITREDHYIFRTAIKKNVSVFTIINLLSIPINFTYAERHAPKYDTHIYQFIASKMHILDSRKKQALSDDPDIMFEITDKDEARLYFYFIRSLIRRSMPACITPVDLSHVQFLLEIPSVRALAHRPIISDEPNELLRFALCTEPGHPKIAATLLSIHAVFDIAEQHNFYCTIPTRKFDLSALIHHEEPMTTEAAASSDTSMIVSAMMHHGLFPEYQSSAAPPLTTNPADASEHLAVDAPSVSLEQ